MIAMTTAHFTGSSAARALCFAGLSALSLAIVACTGESLGKGYSRRGEHIYFRGERIDRAGAHDLDEFAVVARRKLTLCSEVDAASFRVFSEDYTGDENKVYYKWISGPRFWVVEVPGADPETFEVLGLGLAKDANHVWREGSKVEGADADSARALYAGRVWLDDRHVWFCDRVVEGADPATFEPVGDGYHYRDEKRVYWIFNVVRVVEGADPDTFDPSRKHEHGRVRVHAHEAHGEGRR